MGNDMMFTTQTITCPRFTATHKTTVGGQEVEVTVTAEGDEVKASDAADAVLKILGGTHA
jgi:hypothetical protein